MASRARICHILGNLETGGMQTLAIELMRGLDRSRFDPILIHFKAINHFKEEIAEKGWRLRKVPMSRSYRWRDLKTLARVLREEQVDLAHTHGDFANFAGRAAAALAGTPRVIAHYHGHYAHRMNDRFRELERLLAPRTDLILACSRSVEEFLLESFDLSGTPVRLIRNGLNLKSFLEARDRREEIRGRLGIAPGTFHIVHTGRMEPHKNPDRLLDALDLAGDGLGKWRATFAGQGSLFDMMRKKAAELFPGRIWDLTSQKTNAAPASSPASLASPAGLFAPGAPTIQAPENACIHFVGWTREIPEYLASADAMVLCSTHEGLPLSLVEALAAGAPVVASDIPGAREVITHEESGLLVDTANPRTLLRALSQIRRETPLREAIIAGGLRRAKDFSLDRFLADMQSIYEETINRPARPNAAGLGWLEQFGFRFQFRRRIP